MKKIGIFLADGFEEIEGLAVVDILRRAGVEAQMISIMGKREISGSHNIHVQADVCYEDVDFAELDGVVLPGGMPGTLNLGAHAGVNETMKSFAEEGKLVAAVCAAPSVLGQAGLLEGKRQPAIRDMRTNLPVQRWYMMRLQRQETSLPAGNGNDNCLCAAHSGVSGKRRKGCANGRKDCLQAVELFVMKSPLFKYT